MKVVERVRAKRKTRRKSKVIQYCITLLCVAVIILGGSLLNYHQEEVAYRDLMKDYYKYFTLRSIELNTTFQSLYDDVCDEYPCTSVYRYEDFCNEVISINKLLDEGDLTGDIIVPYFDTEEIYRK